MTSEAKKFLLVDSSNINDLRRAIDTTSQTNRALPQATRELNRLDQRMLELINDKSLSEEERVAKYNLTLAEFQQLKSVTTTPPRAALSVKDRADVRSKGYNPLVGIPPIYHKKAEQLLKLITGPGGLDLSDKGAIISQRAYDSSANITDLVNKAINPKFSNKRRVKNWDVFQQMLGELQVPRSLLGANYRDITDDSDSTPINPHQTPTASTSGVGVNQRIRKRLAQGGTWSDWPEAGNRQM